MLTRNIVRVLNTRGVAFITYTNEHNAEFAKEAMAHQGMSISAPSVVLVILANIS